MGGGPRIVRQGSFRAGTFGDFPTSLYRTQNVMFLVIHVAKYVKFCNFCQESCHPKMIRYDLRLVVYIFYSISGCPT